MAGVELGAAGLAAVTALGTAVLSIGLVGWWLGGVCFIAAGNYYGLGEFLITNYYGGSAP